MSAADAAQSASRKGGQGTGADVDAARDARLKAGLTGKDSSGKSAISADASQTGNALVNNATANTLAGTIAGSKTVGSSNTDALRANMATADATNTLVKPLDPRDAAAIAGASGRAVNEGTANTSSMTGPTANAAVANADKASAATVAAAADSANAARKGDDVKTTAAGRNRPAAGIGTTNGASTAVTATAGDAKAIADASAVASGTNANAINSSTVMAPTPTSLQGSNGNSASSAQGSEATSASSAATSSNGAQLSAAALDGLNAFQRVAAQDDAPRLVMTTPITEPGFADELYDTVKLVSTRGLQSVEINIAPAELGPIKLRVDMTGNEADVRFEAAHEATRNLLADAVPALKEQLAQSGIDLRHASIERNASGNGNPQPTGQQAGQQWGSQSGQQSGGQSGQGGQSGGNGRYDNGMGGGRTNGSDPVAQAPAQRLRNALLDTYA